MKKPTTFQLFFNGTILVIMALALYFTFKPYMETSDFRLAEVRAMDRQMVSVSADNVVEMLKGNDQPVMLVVYASWCPICKQVMPQIVALLRDKKLDGVTPIFVSMDSEPRELSKYLVYNDYAHLFMPYRLDAWFNTLPSSLAATGAHFNSEIPYIGFFNESGKMIGEHAGLIDEKAFLELVNRFASKQSRPPLL